jgi:hypothetical protein
MKKYWNHSTKPSTYVVSFEGAVGFVGNYKDGMMYIKSLENKGMISFEEDYLPAMQVTTKRAYRALMVEKELRRDIMKLKKELKSEREKTIQ